MGWIEFKFPIRKWMYALIQYKENWKDKKWYNNILLKTLQERYEENWFYFLKVSWLKHTERIPTLLALNNLSNSLDERVKTIVGECWSEFVLMIKDVNSKDIGDYECQVSGPNHTSISRMMHLNVVGKVDLYLGSEFWYCWSCLATSTHIDNGPDIYVGRNSMLKLICRIDTSGIPLKYIIWRRAEKVSM